jgi:hypothetical protein
MAREAFTNQNIYIYIHIHIYKSAREAAIKNHGKRSLYKSIINQQEKLVLKNHNYISSLLVSAFYSSLLASV